MSKSSRSRDKSRKNRAAKARRAVIPKIPRMVAKPIDVALSFDVKLDMVLAGFAAADAAPNSNAEIITRALVTADDGDILYTYLDQIGGMYLTEQLAKRGIGAYIVHNFLINITDGVNAKVFVNFRTHRSALPKRPVKKGQVIYRDDIADIRAIDFPQFPMPTEGAIVYSFREGWRQALYFDYSMLPDDPNRPLRDLPTLFAQFHNWMVFRELFLIEQDALDKLYAEGWFPFIRLPMHIVVDISKAIQAGNSVAPAAQKAIDAITPETLDEMRAFWKSKPFFNDQAEFIDAAVRHYRNGDYVSATSVLFSRIEGILRQLYVGAAPRTPQLRDKLVDHVRSSVEGTTRFVPEQFRDYLKTFLFAGFNAGAGDIRPSRNSIAHGVAPAAEFSQALAVQYFLILDQIAFYW